MTLTAEVLDEVERLASEVEALATQRDAARTSWESAKVLPADGYRYAGIAAFHAIGAAPARIAALERRIDALLSGEDVTA